MCCCCFCSPLQKEIDICVILDEKHDRDHVQRLFNFLRFKKQGGKSIRVYPPIPKKGKKEKQIAMEYPEAIGNSRAILLVLSDNACREMMTETGNESQYFQYIQLACERARQNQSMILPLFLSRIIRHEDKEGIVKFSSWAYKYKNQEVRTLMERIGSLQGLFVDPHDWESKRDNIHSFFVETHAKLVPLTCRNFRKELDWAEIWSVIGGCCCGCILPAFGLLLLCINSNRWWQRFKIGILAGNLILGFCCAVIFFMIGANVKTLECLDAPNEEEELECELINHDAKQYLYIAGIVMGMWTFLVAICGYLSFKVGGNRKLELGDDDDEEEGEVSGTTILLSK